MSKGGSSLKLDNDLEKRQAESLRIMEKYPDRIHVIVDKAEKFEIPNIDKKNSEKAIFIYVDNVLPPTGEILSSVYEEEKDEDGFLYITYSGLLLTFNLIFFAFVTSAKMSTNYSKHLETRNLPRRTRRLNPLVQPTPLKLGGLANLEAVVCLCTALKSQGSGD
ncbi:unnamed protein product [Brassica napus]|uniref:Autophagy-related protein n=1 Tax=Brassica napus TaxID=3708 RepID=A0A816JY51_BRANA|nr:unnamed protein product [Brassica napus]